MFCAEAPTTAANFRRIIRACVLPRAVLLEGPPGVGKSALVAELAKQCGRKLSRVNLSEHADLSDLVGADLPVATLDDGNQRFAWHDGPLLAAVKSGEWILLDELNLAPQPVLEGLNAVLDHRAELFVPELGTTFKCGPGFRLFATQNAVADSAGRRLLPRSFLDRFTRVSVSNLDHEDLVIIATSKSTVSSPQNGYDYCADLISRLIISLKSRFDFAAGADVNVRDLERWCAVALVEGISRANFAVFGPRCRDDRQHNALKAIVCGLVGSIKPHLVCIDATPDYLQAGAVALPRRNCFFNPTDNGAPSYDDDDDETIGRTRSQLTRCTGVRTSPVALEACARAIRLHWPLLLVGQDAGDLAAQLATAAGATLWRVQLSPATDVADLLGGYEQIDDERLLRRARTRSHAVVIAARRICISMNTGMTLLRAIEDAAKIEEGSSRSDTFENVIRAFIEEVKQSHVDKLELEKFQRATDFAITARRALPKKQRSSGTPPPFKWMDGVVVAAVTRGAWILLEDANLCAPSVLDRLNSLLEPGGVLTLSDGLENDSALRVIEQHPSFRIILSTEPSRGELSRALRNRCVEVFIESTDDVKITLDRWLFPREHIDIDLIEKFIEFSSAMTTKETCSNILNIGSSTPHSWVSSVISCLKAHGSSLILETAVNAFIRRVFIDIAHTNLTDEDITSITARAQSNVKNCLYASRCPRKDIEVVIAHFDMLFTRITMSPIFHLFLATSRELWTALSPSITEESHQYNLEMADSTVAFYSLYSSHFIEQEPPVEARRALARNSNGAAWVAAVRSFSLLEAVIRSTHKVSKSENVVNAISSLIDAAVPCILEDGKLLALIEMLALRLSALVSHQALSTDALALVACRSHDILNTAEKLHLNSDTEKAISRLAVALELMVSEVARRDGTVSSPATWRQCGNVGILWEYIASGGWPRISEDASCIAKLSRYGESLSWPNNESFMGISDDYGRGKKYRFAARLAALIAARGGIALRREASDALATALAALQNGSSTTRLIEAMRESPECLARALEKSVSKATEYWQQATLDLTFDCFDAEDSLFMYDDEDAKRGLSSQSLTIWAYDELDIALPTNTKSTLLQRWASLQMAPLSELSLVFQEVIILVKLHQLANNLTIDNFDNNVKPKAEICVIIKTFVDELLARTVRAPSDVALYTLLHWIIEAKDMKSLERVLRRNLPGMLKRWIERLWSVGTFALDDNRDLNDMNSIDEYALIAPKDDAFDEYQLEHMIVRSTGLRKASNAFVIDQSVAASVRRLVQSATPVIAVMARRQQFVTAIRCLHDRKPLYLVKPLYSLLLSHTIATLRTLYPKQFDTLSDDELLVQVSKAGSGIAYLKDFDTVHRNQDSLLQLIADVLDVLVLASPEFSDVGYGWSLLGAARLVLAAPESKEALDPAVVTHAKRTVLKEMLEHVEGRAAVECVDAQIYFGVDSSPRLEYEHERRRKLMNSDDALAILDLERPLASPRFYDYASAATDFVRSLGNPVRIRQLALKLRQRQCGDEESTWQLAAAQFCQTIHKQHGYYRPDVVEPLTAAIAAIRLGFGLMKTTTNVEESVEFPFYGSKMMKSSINLASILQDELNLAVSGVGHERVQEGVRALVASWRVVEDAQHADSQQFTSGGFTLRGAGVQDEKRDDYDESPLAKGEPILSSRTAVTRNDTLAAVVGVFIRTTIVHNSNLFSRRSLSSALRRAALLESYSQAPVDDRSAAGLSVLLADAFSTKFRNSGTRYSSEAELPVLDSKSLVAHGDKFQTDDWQRNYAMPLICLGLYDVNVANNDIPSLARDAEVYPRLQLSALLIRLRDLLLQWPANSTLERVARIADAILRSDAFTTTPTQILNGVEILLNRAQDWQEHCAREFSLEDQLAPLRTFVTSGRKRELSTWSYLLRKCDVKAAQNHVILLAMPWLDALFMRNERNIPVDQGPKWLFSSTREGGVDDPVYVHPDTFIALETFIQSATIGDFGSRLILLQAFSTVVDSSAARCLSALIEHFSHFISTIENERYTARDPAAKSLCDEQRLARWDDRNFHALADCSEKSKRKLSKLLRDYDEVLQRPIRSILTRLASPPVWSSQSSMVPTNLVIFPALPAIHPQPKKTMKKTIRHMSKQKVVQDFEVASTRYASRLDVLTRRMREIASLCALPQKSIAASEITETIFARIQNLRSNEKMPRSAKRRAVVDLIKGLQRHGLARVRVPQDAMQARTSTCAVEMPRKEDEIAFIELASARRYATLGSIELGYLRSEYPQKTRDITSREAVLLKSLCESLSVVVLEQRAHLCRTLMERREYIKVVERVSGRERIRLQEEYHCITLRRAAESVAQLRVIADAVADATMHENDSEYAKVKFVATTLHTLEENLFDANLTEYKSTLRTAASTIQEAWFSTSALRPDIIDSTIQFLLNAEQKDDNAFSEFVTLEMTKIDAAIEAALLSAQVLAPSQENTPSADSDTTLIDEHDTLLVIQRSLALDRSTKALEELRGENPVKSQVCDLSLTLLSAVDGKLVQIIEQYRAISKLLYVLTRVVRTLFSLGLCEVEECEDENEQQGEEDGEGTGMGDGAIAEDAKDVSNEITNEEQLLGTKQENEIGREEDFDGGKEEKKDPTEDKSKEMADDNGVEMEAGFEGEMQDIENKEDDVEDEEDNYDDTESIDRELGEVGQGADTVDERLWDEQDEPGEDTHDQTLKASRADGAEQLKDEIRDKDDDESSPLQNDESDKQESKEQEKSDDAFSPLQHEDESQRAPGRANQREDGAANDNTVDDDVDQEEKTEEHSDVDLPLEETVEFPEGAEAEGGEIPGEEAREGGDNGDYELPDDMEIEDIGMNEECGEDSDSIEEKEDGAQDMEVEAEDKELDDSEGQVHGETNIDAEMMAQQKSNSKAEDVFGAATKFGDEALQATGQGNEGAEEGEAQPDASGNPSGSLGNRTTGQNESNDHTSGKDLDKRPAPNPYRDAGDALKHWHRRLEIADRDDLNEEESSPMQEDDEYNESGIGQYEYARQDEHATAQALGGIGSDEQVPALPPEETDVQQSKSDERSDTKGNDSNEESQAKISAESAKRQRSQRDDDDDSTSRKRRQHDQSSANTARDEDMQTKLEEKKEEESLVNEQENDQEAEKVEEIVHKNLDSEKPIVQFDVKPTMTEKDIVMEESPTASESVEDNISTSDIDWRDHVERAAPVARRLCESLRTVLTPTVANRLRGDYRTGKRLSMRRVVDYIASGYRRDKIWMRRTKAAKRSYQILVAIDDSLSMAKSGAGDSALTALAALSTALSQLDAGDMSIMAFGDDVRILHEFHDGPFQGEAARRVASRFRFDRPITNAVALLKTAIPTLRNARLAVQHRTNRACLQLMIIVSDGHFDSGSRQQLMRLHRDAADDGVAIILILLDQPGRNSLLEMKLVSFNVGQVQTTPYLEGYPFPCFVLLKDVAALPETLAHALKQWFEFYANSRS